MNYSISVWLKTWLTVLSLVYLHQGFMQRMPSMLLEERWLGKLIISERQGMDSILGGSEILSELKILKGCFHSSAPVQAANMLAHYFHCLRKQSKQVDVFLQEIFLWNFLGHLWKYWVMFLIRIPFVISSFIYESIVTTILFFDFGNLIYYHIS